MEIIALPVCLLLLALAYAAPLANALANAMERTPDTEIVSLPGLSHIAVGISGHKGSGGHIDLYGSFAEVHITGKDVAITTVHTPFLESELWEAIGAVRTLYVLTPYGDGRSWSVTWTRLHVHKVPAIDGVTRLDFCGRIL